MSDAAEALKWNDKYNHDAALVFYKPPVPDQRGYDLRICFLCGEWVGGGMLGRYGRHLECVHELVLMQMPAESAKKKRAFLHAARAAGASAMEIAKYLGARVVEVHAQAASLGQPALRHIEEQVNLGREILAQIETLAGLGCTPAQIVEQLVGVPAPT